jgi:hypothetical protein
MKQISENYREYNVDTVDFRQVYDCILREKLLGVLMAFGILSKIVGLLNLTMMDTESQVIIQNYLTDGMPITQGLKQGEGLSRLLFNLALEYIIRQLNVDANKTLAYKSTHLGICRRYNYGVSVQQAAKETCLETWTAAEELGLELNANKDVNAKPQRPRTN